jgi:hypothetical protein
MTRKMIINNFDKSIELCTDWGWYVDLDNTNHRNGINNKSKMKISSYIIEIMQQNTQENGDEYEYYMNEFDKKQEKIPRIPTYLETIKEEEDIYSDNKDKDETKYETKNNNKVKQLLKITSATLVVTGLLTYFIIFIN